MVVETAKPVISGNFTLPAGQFDKPYQAGKPSNGYKLSATGGYPFSPTQSTYLNGYYWQIIPGKLPSQNLPQGMTLNANGVISGTPVWPKPPIPSSPQTYTIQVRATDFLGKSAIATFTLVIAPPLGPEIITDCPLPQGLEKYPYPLVQLKALNGKLSYTWPKPAGLPPGLVWNEKGYISGTPTTRGDYPIVIKVVDANGLFYTKNCTITIRPAPELDCPNIPCARVGDILSPVKLQARGGDLPYNYTAVGLPPSITINSTTGLISGTFSSGGNITYNATYTVTDAFGRTANKTCPIEVRDELLITTASPLPFGIKGSAYPGKTGAPTVTINATGGWQPYTRQRLIGALPPGLTLNTVNGAIIGTPTQIGTYKFTIRVYDSCKPPEKFVDKEFEITIYDPITVFPQPSSCLTVNKTFSLNMTVSGGSEIFAWGNLISSQPVGNASISIPVSTNSRIANITGIPTTAGPLSFTFNVTSTPLAIIEMVTVNYTVNPELKNTSSCPPTEATVGAPYLSETLTAVGGKGNRTWNATITRNGTTVAAATIVGGKFLWNPQNPTGGFAVSGGSSGIPHKVVISVRDECGNIDPKECDVTLYPALTCNQTLNLPCLFNGKVLPETTAFQATGGKPPYTWNLLPSNNSTQTLPAGLTQKNPPSGNGSVLSGNITENGTFSFIARVTDSLGNSCSRAHSITVHPKLSFSVPSPLPSGKVNQAYLATLAGSGGDGNYSWSLDASSIPTSGFTNLQINSSTGIISGTPTQKGFYKITVILEDGCGQSISKEVEIPVEDLVYAITPNTEINIWFDASGSMSEVLPVLQKMQSEVLKPCLVQFFNGNGTLFDQRVKVRQYYDERAFNVLNTQGTTMAITQVINLAFSDEAQSNYHADLNSFNGSRTSPYETDVAALRGTLSNKPSYIRGAVLRVTGCNGFLEFLNAVKGSTGAFAGTYGLSDQNDIRLVPNVARPGGGVGTATPLPGSPMYYGNEIISALNSMGFTLKLCDKAQDPPVSLTPQIVSQNPLEGPMVGVPYQGILSAVGGILPYTWNLPTGTLPSGLTFNSTTGLISGMPTTVQTSNFSVKVTDTNNASDQKRFSLAVTWPPLAVDWSEGTPTLTAGQPADPETFTASGGDGNYSWTISSGSLPPGITLSGNSGASISLSGTPTAPGTYNFRVRVSSAGSFNDIDVSYIVEVDDAPNPSQMITVVGGTLPLSSELAGQTVATFQIGKYEVTWDEWQEVRTWAVANGYSDLGLGQGVADNHPVQVVNWYDAVKWCNARSEKEGLMPVYNINGNIYRAGIFDENDDFLANESSSGYRLPSEKEWEWAARGGVSSLGYTYSGSNDINAVAWYNVNSGNSNEVGTKAENELGIYDMSGNAPEWTGDWWMDDFEGSIFSFYGRVRGGSWSFGALYCNVADRSRVTDLGNRGDDLGFRVARSSGN